MSNSASSDSPIWPVLAKVLALGGTFRGDGPANSFSAPYIYSSWPESVDPFENVTAVGRDVALRTECHRATGIGCTSRP
jgi:hypothetical protein